ncbi:5-(carboxyamino)imidazole ribonucleotide mutase [Coxiella endosymbiont of Amblyomma nuttalli]|uniref:5-(carboxyamino)imidazole ribonucleotide mutase n=1 Tax=Coxiella endosymbiont of Amblyomma nuttalli TaxID=2749996 RepID=UPI001BA4B47C|nr:5-(carboxyamino)imidazole ribonucleotide mutase [Coxiella endosymbiont of Amblyomma nuttalli]
MEVVFIELESLDITFEAHILSAHRTPIKTIKFVEDADRRGCAVFIAAAGLAAHLAGTVASYTIKPVIGVPMASGSLGGLDALLSTVQMPSGVPVACTAIGKAGAKNAAILAAQIIALKDEKIAKKLRKKRALKQDALQKADKKFQKTYNLNA